MQLPSLTAPTLGQVVTSPLPFIILWWVGGLLTLILPRSKWNKSKSNYYNYYGRYNQYEQNQRNYEEGGQNGNYQNQNGNYQNQNGNYQNQNGNYQNQNGNYYNGQQGGQGGENGQYYNNNAGGQQQNAYACKWWQYKCRQQQYYWQRMRQGGGGGENNRGWATPNWYQFLGGVNEEEDREGEEQRGLSSDGGTGAVKFVYAWSVIMFVGLLIFGTIVFWKRKAVGTMCIILAMITQYSLLMMILLPQGVISTDDRDLENSVYGWHGQTAVLMVYFYYAQVLFGLIFLVLVGIKVLFDRFVSGGTGKKPLIDEDKGTYQSAAKLDIS